MRHTVVSLCAGPLLASHARCTTRRPANQGGDEGGPTMRINELVFKRRIDICAPHWERSITFGGPRRCPNGPPAAVLSTNGSVACPAIAFGAPRRPCERGGPCSPLYPPLPPCPAWGPPGPGRRRVAPAPGPRTA